MLIVESLGNKQTLIQITSDEIYSALYNHSNKCFLLDFLKTCKECPPSYLPAIFIGNTRNPNMSIPIKQYIDFSKQIQKQIISIAKRNNVNVFKHSCFCILLHGNPITRKEYEKNLNIFKKNIFNIQSGIFQPGDFGLIFENILIDILDNKSKYIIQPNQFKSKLSKDNQLLEHKDYSLLTDSPANNPIIRYFNRYFKSKKNSDCVNLSSQSKTDIFYKNKNGSLNEISIKTKMVHHNDTPLFTEIKFTLSVSGNELLDWKECLQSDPIKTIKMFFNRQYDTKPDLKSPYTSNKNDNVKFLLMYLYNLDNPNDHVSGNIYIINMKRMFIFLQYYVDNNMVNLIHKPKSLEILINGELTFSIKKTSLTSKKSSNTIIYFYLNFDNPNSLFRQLIDFQMPLHLDSQCWINHD